MATASVIIPAILASEQEGYDPSKHLLSISSPADESVLQTSSVDLGSHGGAGDPFYELRPLPVHLSDRSRQHSTLKRADSTFEIQSIAKEQITDDGSPSKPTMASLDFADTDKAASQLAAKFNRRSRIQFAALCWCLYIEGWNDGSTGSLLPIIQQIYHVGFAVVSLIFVVNCLGFILGAASNVWLNDRLGFGKVMVIGSVFQLAAYVIQAPGPPFPVIVLANWFGGFGMSLQNAQANGFVGSLNQHMATKLGMMHACYGLGAFSSPFVATYFSGTRHWSFHFLVSAGLAISNVATLILVFRFKTQDVLLAEVGQDTGEADTARESKYRQILNLQAVHYLAIFALIYIGVEVTLGGWIVTFIIRERDGGHSAGFISSGFFGGLALGRVGLMWFTKLIGEHRAIFFYAVLSIGLEITIWVVPSIIENAIAVSVIGLLFGPMFPILVSHASHILPARLLTACVGWITGIGMAGSAALPFLTGILASKYGIGALQPLMISMMCTLVALWAFVPKDVARRID